MAAASLRPDSHVHGQIRSGQIRTHASPYARRLPIRTHASPYARFAPTPLQEIYRTIEPQKDRPCCRGIFARRRGVPERGVLEEALDGDGEPIQKRPKKTVVCLCCLRRFVPEASGRRHLELDSWAFGEVDGILVLFATL